MQTVNIIGAGLSGCEAALTLSEFGFKVNLFECRPKIMPEIFKTSLPCELVCSNSLGSIKPNTASGILKSELLSLNSHVLNAAFLSQIPGGNALCVDRYKFSEIIYDKIKCNPLINYINQEISTFSNFNQNEIIILATGPLTTKNLYEYLKQNFFNKSLYFYDAVSPIIDANSIDMTYAFWQNRYGPLGEGDYLNIALNKEEYINFYNELINAKTVVPHENEKEIYFEGCMPIEEIARRGKHTLRFGPMKPKGIIDPKTNKMPYAVVQLRAENVLFNSFNIVGFQTKMTFKEQERVLSKIPGLNNLKILRYGVIHKNIYIHSPSLVNYDLSLKNNPNIYIAGQLLGSEGYCEAILGGKIAALNIIVKFYNNIKSVFEMINPLNTMSGLLINYLTSSNLALNKFVPMNSNFGLIKDNNLKANFYDVSKAEINKLSNILETLKKDKGIK